MSHYDPAVKPDPQEWLALDEYERVVLCEAYHRAAGIRLPNLRLHSATHAVVENQIAMGIESVVRAENRLQEQGLDRHDTIHAIGSVLAKFIFDTLESQTPAVRAEYEREVEQLTAAGWLATARVAPMPVLGRIQSKRRKKP